MFLLQRVHLPCPALRSKAMLVLQAFDPVQIRPSCPEFTPLHPPLQWSLSTSTEQVLAKPFPHSMAPLPWEHREDSTTGGPCQGAPPGKALLGTGPSGSWRSAKSHGLRSTGLGCLLGLHWWWEHKRYLLLTETAAFATPAASACAALPPSYCPPSFHVLLFCAFVLIPF